MADKTVYFTWPDQRFFYQCANCGECCKGLGIGLDDRGGQVSDLVDRYPQLVVFLRKRGTTWTAYNPRGRCWFLASDGRCGVERDHGRAAKPASCRLFPFNRVFRIGAHTVVDYNSVICPLRVSPPRVSGQQVTGQDFGYSGLIGHDDVLAEIASTDDPSLVGIQLPVDRPDEEGRRFVTRERAVAKACFDQAASEQPDVAPVWRIQAGDGAFERASARLSRALDVVTGQPLCLPSNDTSRIALWLTPSMRFNELFGPRDYDPRPEREKLLPEIWLAWLHFLAQAEQLSSAAMDMRGATGLWSEIVPLAYLFARWRHAPVMEPGPVELPGPADPDRVIEQFAQSCMDNRKARKPLNDLLTPLIESYLPRHRIALARMIEPLYRQIRWRRARR
ncbi:MAG: YkgJ family cysteine cluster protein [Proteobacteria bacterium]|nr:YkgJ family cysteine cluster protein [Pseudomonadota bacterium]